MTVDFNYKAKVVINVILVGIALRRLFTIWRKQHFNMRAETLKWSK